MSRMLDIACLQTRPMPDFTSALGEALPLAHAAVKAGADIIFLPEYCGGLKSEGSAVVPPSAPEERHIFLHNMQEFARKHQVWLNLGSIAVDGPDGRIINRGYMIDDRGELRSHYDKIHMFDVYLSQAETYLESTHVNPGCEAVIHDTPFARIGHTICYDLRFPGLFRQLAQAGAEIIICPAAFTKRTGEAHWHILNQARAIETTRFIISPCAIGPIPGGGESYGHSLVVSPWGEVISDGGNLPGVVQARIDLDMVAKTESRIPSLTGDRDYTLGANQ